MMDVELSEKDWDAQLFGKPKGVATMLGWKTYHTLRSKGSQPGYPDRTVVRDRILFVELKTDERASKPTDRQVKWLDALASAGGECYLWRPSDLDEVAVILARRWTFLDPTRPGHPVRRTPFPPFLTRPAREALAWTPRSLWIPDVGRADQLPWYEGSGFDTVPPR